MFTEALSAAFKSLEIRGAEATSVRYKHATSCLVAYRLDLAEGPARVYARAHRPDAVEKLAKVAIHAPVPGPLGAGGAVLGDLSVAAYAFPNDRRVEALPRLVDDEGRARLLTKALAGQPGGLDRGTLEALRYKPERRFVARLDAAGGASALVKAYDHEDYGAAARAAKAVSSTARLSVPRLLGRSARRALLIFEWLPGDTLGDVLLDPHRAPGAASAVGAALAELHGQAAPGLPSATPEREVEALRSAVVATAILAPELASRADELSDRLATSAPASPGTAALHGDFSADQVLVAGETVAIIDLDQSARGDPLADLGSYLADLERRVIVGEASRVTADSAGAGLVEGYERAIGHEVDRAGLAWHLAARLLRLTPDPFRNRDRRWPALVAALLERAERAAADA